MSRFYKFLQSKLRRNVIYAALLGLVIFAYIWAVFYITALLNYRPEYYAVITAMAVLIAAIGFHPLELKLRELTDRFFYRQRAGYHQTITHLLKNLSSCSDLSRLAECLTSTINDELKVENLALFLRGSSQQTYEIVHSNNWRELLGIWHNDPLVQYMLEHRKIIWKENLLSGTLLKNDPQAQEVFNKMNALETEIVIPFLEDKELVGFLMLGRRASGEPYFKEDLKLLELLSSQTVLALRNTHLFEISQNKVKELTMLFEVSRLVSSTLDIDEIYTNIIKEVIQVINVDRGILFFYNDQHKELRSVAGYAANDPANPDLVGMVLQVEDSVLGRIFKAGNPVLVPHTTRNTEYVKRLGADNYVAVPMKAKEKVIGLLTIDNAPSQRPLDNLNMDLLMTLAGQMAIAIENARLYDDAQERIKELSRLNRVSSLGTMVAGIAHEIKNPLTALDMCVQLLDISKGSPETWAEFGPIISTEIKRLKDIVEEFLGFARTPEINVQTVGLTELTEKVCNLVKTQAKQENVELVLKLEDNVQIKADTQKFTQVLLNLILNAIQAMPKNRPFKGYVELSAKKDEVKENKINIMVKDNGCGISKENQKKLFQPFFTTKQSGTGLGLSIAHKIIEEHGGMIKVDSRVNFGTTFTIQLPIVKQTIPEKLKTEQTTRSA